MTCGCIDDINAKLAPEHSLDSAVIITGSLLEARICTALLRKDTGNRERRLGKPSYVAATFCPFCGVRYSGTTS